MSKSKKSKLTPAQREAKRERDRRYRANKKARLAAVKKTGKAKLSEKIKLGKKVALPDLNTRVKAVSLALRALSVYLIG